MQTHANTKMARKGFIGKKIHTILKEKDLRLSTNEHARKRNGDKKNAVSYREARASHQPVGRRRAVR